MPTTPLALANAFLQRHAPAEGIQHMKLQKLCYYAYGWWLTEYDPLVNKGPEAWRYGPVFNAVYQTYSFYGSLPIMKPLKTMFEPKQALLLSDEALSLVDWIWSKYGRHSAIKLSEMTHEPGTPWHRVAKEHNYKVPQHFVIPDDYIREYFNSDKAANEVA